MANDMFHKAARDGYLDLLREATRRDCNKLDEDGLSPTLWAAFYGNLDALRMIVGRGGDPDKCDYFGSTALHHAASNGHMNCVTFLVSFGCNLWALDNKLRTALEIAGLSNRSEVVRYLDSVCDKQASLNKKIVKKLKEKAVLDAQKRIKKMNKMESKAMKKAEKDDLKLVKLRKKMEITGKSNSAPVSKHSTVRSRISAKTTESEPKPYSAHFNTLTSQNSKFAKSGVAKKLKNRQRYTSHCEVDGDFKVREIESDGKKTIRSLSGLKRDPHILYMKNKHSDSISSTDSGHSRDEISTNRHFSDTISRAISEPDFYYNGDSGVELLDSPEPNPDQMSMFERPGFGSVAFINRRMMSTGTLMDFPNDTEVFNSQSSISTSGSKNNKNSEPNRKNYSRQMNNFDTGSIGTVGSLAARMKSLPWDDDLIDINEDSELTDNSTLEFFLACNHLSEYYGFFVKEDIDLQAMMLLTEGDLKELGLPMGPRRKLLQAISKRRSALAKPSVIVDTLL